MVWKKVNTFSSQQVFPSTSFKDHNFFGLHFINLFVVILKMVWNQLVLFIHNNFFPKIFLSKSTILDHSNRFIYMPFLAYGLGEGRGGDGMDGSEHVRS